MSHVQSSAGNGSTRRNIKFVGATYTVLTQDEDATSFHVQMRQSKCSEVRVRHSFRCTFSSRFYIKRPHFNPTAFSNHYSYSRFFFFFLSAFDNTTSVEEFPKAHACLYTDTHHSAFKRLLFFFKGLDFE